MDKFKIDSQKVSYFPERLGRWFTAGNNWEKLKKVYPIYMEVSPSSGCNHRCIFCALDYLEYKGGFLNYQSYTSFIKIAAEKGVKSIMFGGEGEPLLHPQIINMVINTKKAGIDVAFTTNGSLMTAPFLDKTIKYVNWIKVSLDAGSANTHMAVHRAAKSDYESIINNLSYAVKLRNQKKCRCSIGVQLLLLPQNFTEVLSLAKMVKKMGADYFVVKPYSPGLYSKNKFAIDYKKYLYLEKKINGLSNHKFNAVFRSRAFVRAAGEGESYRHCLAVPFFWAYLMTNGDVYSCSAFLGNKKFILGNINDKKFDEIWESEKRKKNWKYIKGLSINHCRENCRMDKVNVYLDDLTNPPENYTFI